MFPYCPPARRRNRRHESNRVEPHHVWEYSSTRKRLLGREPDLERVLLALLRTQNNLASEILEQKGFTLEGLREEIRRRYKL